jgi:SHS2 domain-containing protein
MKPYEIIEHTADVGLKANGLTLKELFENAARGMFEIIGGKGYAEPVEIEKDIRIKKQVEGLEELLVDWLSELLYLFNKERILFRGFKILELNNNGLTGKSSGEKIDPEHANLKTEIKAVTFHDLKIEEDETGFSCKIIFDV